MADILKDELASDPLTRGYATMSDAEAADSLNAIDIEQNRVSMTGSEVLNALNKAEFIALSAADKQRVWDVIHLGTINPFGVEADIMVDIFTPESASIASLIAARIILVSRASQLGLGHVRVGHVQEARR